jgi:hypothetical protein
MRPFSDQLRRMMCCAPFCPQTVHVEGLALLVKPGADTR